jgi:GrpB-like predicted nucleotidyltransferase (UPF0157 family)
MNVIIVEYSPHWPAMFESEQQRLRTALAAAAPVIEHVGSTSVVGLAAKPIIDIMIGLPDFAVADDLVAAVTALGYEYIARYEDVMPYRRFFKKHAGEVATHHIHMVGIGGEFWERHLLFRDYLRATPAAAGEYAALKRELATREWADGNEYAAAKTDFIRAAESTARAHFSNT